MKRLLVAILFAVLAVAGGLAWWLHGNLDRLLRDAIIEQGSQLVGGPVSLKAARLSPTDGLGELDELVIGNPPGFKTAHALKIRKVSLQVELASLTGPVIEIRKLELLGPDAIYERGGRQSNFDAIAAHLAERARDERKAEGANGVKATGPERRYIVDRLSIRDARAELGATLLGGKTLSVDLLPLELRDLGKRQGGLSAAELGDAISQEIHRQLISGLGPNLIARPAESGLEKAGQALKKLFKP